MNAEPPLALVARALAARRLDAVLIGNAAAGRLSDASARHLTTPTENNTPRVWIADLLIVGSVDPLSTPPGVFAREEP